jgi:hypothetical protein
VIRIGIEGRGGVVIVLLFFLMWLELAGDATGKG